ncbi:hypothetical protein AKG98_2859 [Moritella sp. JT01]|uniref:RHS repeat-associated core domain-containing protein n=1 Tax=Moritella sp. JT01 TaxID=756698 RepID=UPI00079A5CFD|nr:RHS repeat-associated core domain-containing protein [Moritella sp. JT01]KXO06765.1 hypothetical protein AKG98_2859 [Moritella sp. JT01]
MSKKQFSGTVFNRSRRRFLKSTAAVSAASLPMVPGQSLARGLYASSTAPLRNNPLGFNGERQDPVTGCYHLGQGYRVYNPRLMRFHAYDSMSPFGRGGTHGYAYCLGDPINQRDPSGHFALLSLLIGAIVGAVIGAGIAAAAEGIQCAINPEHKFDWKQVGIGAALGFISGGFGAAAQGANTSVKVGLAVADAVFSGAADFGLNVAAGTPVKQAGINAGIGAVIGLGAFGVGRGIGKIGKSLSKTNRIAKIKSIGLSGGAGSSEVNSYMARQGNYRGVAQSGYRGVRRDVSEWGAGSGITSQSRPRKTNFNHYREKTSFSDVFVDRTNPIHLKKPQRVDKGPIDSLMMRNRADVATVTAARTMQNRTIAPLGIGHWMLAVMDFLRR